jgi:tripartite ATP-independent transporter DctM subunit
MTALFLVFGYMGVPVSFALIGGVLVATAFTQISMQSMIGQLFHGIDSETLLAVPFFLLVGELMASSDVAHRMIRLSQTLVGHLRGGLAQVVTVFSMFFAGISGSSTADVAVLSRTIARDMDREGYDRAFTAALIASASTMANLIPPSIMAVVYGATGNVSIGGLFLAGVVPGVLIGIGLMIYSYFWGPVGIMKKRAPFSEVIVAARGSALPLVIPVIIMGGILSGWFTPTEAGMMAAIYILVVLIPVLNRGHVRELPRDFMYAGLLYSLPLAAVAGASAFGWMVAYLRGPDIVASHITAFAGDERHDDHVPAGLRLRHRRRLHRRGAGDHHLHADHQQADRGGQHQAAAHGRGDHHDAGVRADHAALRAVAAGGVEVRRHRLRQGGGALAAALRRLLPDDRLRRRLSRHRAVVAEAVPAGIGRLLQGAGGQRLHLPA